jgi:hypothetical protein
MDNIFAQATKRKLRFTLNGSPEAIAKPGNLSTEDLWDLGLDDLDRIAMVLDTRIRTAPTKSFVNEATEGNRELIDLNLKLQILVEIINTKKALKEANAERAKQHQQKELIRSVLADKQAKALNDLSVEELEALLKH